MLASVELEDVAPHATDEDGVTLDQLERGQIQLGSQVGRRGPGGARRLPQWLRRRLGVPATKAGLQADRLYGHVVSGFGQKRDHRAGEDRLVGLRLQDGDARGTIHGRFDAIGDRLRALQSVPVDEMQVEVPRAFQPPGDRPAAGGRVVHRESGRLTGAPAESVRNRLVGARGRDGLVELEDERKVRADEQGRIGDGAVVEARAEVQLERWIPGSGVGGRAAGEGGPVHRRRGRQRDPLPVGPGVGRHEVQLDCLGGSGDRPLVYAPGLMGEDDSLPGLVLPTDLEAVAGVDVVGATLGDLGPQQKNAPPRVDPRLRHHLAHQRLDAGAGGPLGRAEGGKEAGQAGAHLLGAGDGHGADHRRHADHRAQVAPRLLPRQDAGQRLAGQTVLRLADAAGRHRVALIQAGRGELQARGQTAGDGGKDRLCPKRKVREPRPKTKGRPQVAPDRIAEGPQGRQQEDQTNGTGQAEQEIEGLQGKRHAQDPRDQDRQPLGQQHQVAPAPDSLELVDDPLHGSVILLAADGSLCPRPRREWPGPFWVAGARSGWLGRNAAKPQGATLHLWRRKAPPQPPNSVGSCSSPIANHSSLPHTNLTTFRPIHSAASRMSTSAKASGVSQMRSVIGLIVRTERLGSSSPSRSSSSGPRT